MTERWISEGRQWCKYCRIYISSNVNQILQHQNGRKHQYNEEAFIREVSLKVTSTPAGASAVANELLNRINELQNGNVTHEQKPVEPIREPETKPAETANVVRPMDEVTSSAYPASAHDAHGQWIQVPVAKVEDEAKVVDERAPGAEEVVVDEKMEKEVEVEESKVLRIGATDEGDEEEAAVREEAKMASGTGVGDDDASAADWDALECKLRKRTIRKKKRKRL